MGVNTKIQNPRDRYPMKYFKNQGNECGCQLH